MFLVGKVFANLEQPLETHGDKDGPWLCRKSLFIRKYETISCSSLMELIRNGVEEHATAINGTCDKAVLTIHL